jgi:hypothetical protein
MMLFICFDEKCIELFTHLIVELVPVEADEDEAIEIKGIPTTMIPRNSTENNKREKRTKKSVINHDEEEEKYNEELELLKDITNIIDSKRSNTLILNSKNLELNNKMKYDKMKF